MVVIGTGIGPEEEDGGHIGCHIVPSFGGTGELDDAWPGLGRALGERTVDPGYVIGHRVADVGQVSKEGDVGIDVVP